MAILYDLSKLPSETREQIETRAKYTAWFSKFPDKLLGYSTSEDNKNDAKTGKSLKYDILTAILYLIPSDGSGINLCPMAKIAKCDGPCLNTAGRGAMGSVQVSRLRKTLFMLQYPKEFEAMLRKEIRKLEKRAKKLGLILKIRLNGTSDVRWEREFPEILQEFQEFMYDYTKIPNRNIGNFPKYDLTFSYSGVKEYQPFVKQAIDNGLRIAVVFKHKDKIPHKFLGMYCINGDDSDDTSSAPNGVVWALYAKGKARNDTSGFVVDNTFMGV